MSSIEKDINDVFDDIVLTEENLSKKYYEEGYQEGLKEINCGGYELGFSKGHELGEELGSYYGTVVAYLQLENSEKTKKCLIVLKELIDKFPQTNDKDEDIIGKVEEIRNQYKKIKSILKLSETKNKKDLTF